MEFINSVKMTQDGETLNSSDELGVERFMRYVEAHNSIVFNKSIAFIKDCNVYAFYFTLDDGEIICRTKRFTPEHLTACHISAETALNLVSNSFGFYCCVYE